jgi:hypothetical protein
VVRSGDQAQCSPDACCDNADHSKNQWEPRCVGQAVLVLVLATHHDGKAHASMLALQCLEWGKDRSEATQGFLDQQLRPSTVWMSKLKTFQVCNTVGGTRVQTYQINRESLIYGTVCASNDKSRMVTRTAALLCVAVRRSSEWRSVCPKSFQLHS